MTRSPGTGVPVTRGGGSALLGEMCALRMATSESASEATRSASQTLTEAPTVMVSPPSATYALRAKPILNGRRQPAITCWQVATYPVLPTQTPEPLAFVWAMGSIPCLGGGSAKKTMTVMFRASANGSCSDEFFPLDGVDFWGAAACGAAAVMPAANRSMFARTASCGRHIDSLPPKLGTREEEKLAQILLIFGPGG